MLDEMNFLVKGWLLGLSTIIESQGQLQVDYKANIRDLVTQVDRAIEADFKQLIQTHWPHHTVIGEEGYQGQSLKGYEDLWIIDPIDGTVNFVKQGRDYGCLIAYFHQGQAQLAFAYDIQVDSLLIAQKGQGVRHNGELLEPVADLPLSEGLISLDVRRLEPRSLTVALMTEAFGSRYWGCSTVDGMRVALGQAVAFINPGGGAWDLAPYILIAEELGLHLSHFDGQPIDLDRAGDHILATPAAYKTFSQLYQLYVPG